MKVVNPTSVTAINATRGCEKIPPLDAVAKSGIVNGRNTGGKLTAPPDKIPGAGQSRWGSKQPAKNMPVDPAVWGKR